MQNTRDQGEKEEEGVDQWKIVASSKKIFKDAKAVFKKEKKRKHQIFPGIKCLYNSNEKG